MYTLEQLQQKTFGELKAIGWELNVLPEGDRRRRESWIDAIVGVNPPLLQLLEVSPAASVEQVQKPIIETVETSPGVELEPVPEAPLESKFGRIVYPRPAQGAIATPKFKVGNLVRSKTMTWGLEKKSMTGTVLELLPRGGVRVQFGDHISGYGGTFDFSKSQLEDLIPVQEIEPIDALVNTSQRQEPIEPIDALVNTSQRQEPIEPIDAFVNTSQRQEAIEPIDAFVNTSQRQEAIAKAPKTSPGVEVDRVQQPIEDYFDIKELWELDHADCPACGGIDSLDARWSQEYAYGYWIIYCQECDSTCSCSVEDLPPCLRGEDDDEDDDTDSEDSPGVEVDHFPECVECFGDGYFEDDSGLIKSCSCSSSETKLSRQKTQSAIAPAAKNLPSSRSKTSTAHQLLESFKSSAHIIEDSSGVKTEGTVSGSAIEPAVKNSIDAESDPNPILTGIPLSDRFVARYSPPQPENIIFKSEPDGQLSLLDFEVQSQDEPPDPDDFESLDAFHEAIARWDFEHPNSSDHCSDHLPSSLHCEPPNPEDFDSMFAFWAAYDAWDKATDDNSEPLEVSLDSFCEWAPCPEDWYEPHTLLEPSKVSELSPICKSSITSDFFIPTFGSLGDRFDRNDEPPDTGIFARLPKPKPPTFPPQASWTQVGHKLDASWTQLGRASRNYPETIPKLFSCVATGSSTQPARSPPGGDA